MEAPYRLPDKLDLISWSMPFLAEKITGMLYQILKICSPEELLEIGDGPKILAEETEEMKEKAARKNRLRQKILSLGKMRLMLGNLREN